MAFPALACLLLQTSLADGHVRTPHPNGFMFINSGYIVVYRVPNGCVWVKKKKNATSRRDVDVRISGMMLFVWVTVPNSQT